VYLSCRGTATCSGGGDASAGSIWNWGPTGFRSNANGVTACGQGLDAFVLLIISRPESGTTGSVSTQFRLLGPNDKIVVDGFNDPKLEGAACHIARAQTGGVKALWVSQRTPVTPV
jgi:hypothetical protein